MVTTKACKSLTMIAHGVVRHGDENAGFRDASANNCNNETAAVSSAAMVVDKAVADTDIEL